MNTDAADAFFSIFGLLREDTINMDDLSHRRWTSVPDPVLIEDMQRLLAQEKTNRNLIKGLSQRIDTLERGETALTPPGTRPERPEDV